MEIVGYIVMIIALAYGAVTSTTLSHTRSELTRREEELARKQERIDDLLFSQRVSENKIKELTEKVNLYESADIVKLKEEEFRKREDEYISKIERLEDIIYGDDL